MGMSNHERRKCLTKDLVKLRQYGLVESFSGPGGMGLGLSWAGFDLQLAFDYDEMAVATHQHNFRKKCFAKDAREVTGEWILSQIGFHKGELPLFAGGPPCQGFSKQRRNAHLGDDRNDLVLEYIRLVHEIEPRFFIFENVAIFGQKRGQQYLSEMFRSLSKYILYPHFYNSADYGLPQTRERFIVVGRHLKEKVSFRIPKPTVREWQTVGSVLSGLPEPPEDYTEHPKYPNHQRARVTQKNIERFSYVPEGGGWKDIPKELRLSCHANVDTAVGGWPDVYGRLSWDGQCPTITGGFDSFTRGRYGHPKFDRPITPREAARIQGFPDTFIFKGNRSDIRSQIGNAVPPPLAKAIGIEILCSLMCTDGLLEYDESDMLEVKQLSLF